jgi:hypothetical protein
MVKPRESNGYRRLGVGVSLTLVLLVGTGLGWRYWSPASRAEVGAFGSPLPVHDLPVPVTYYPLEQAVGTEADLAAAADTVRPYFGRNKVPISLVYHALRVWGPRAPFGAEESHVLDGEGLCGDGLFLRILTNQAAYQAYSQFTLDRLLVPSPFGVQVVTAVDAGWGQEWGSTHVGKYLQVMADLGVPAATPLQLDGGRQASLTDVVWDEARRCHPAEEPEWLTCGLARYLAVPRWQNRFEQWLAFDDLADQLTLRPFGKGACLGTHVPNALATLLNAHTHRPLLAPDREAAVRRRLREYSRHLTKHQRPDGSWGPDWAAGEAAGVPLGGIVLEQGSLLATGHHLEWMCLCPPDLRPDALVLERAARFLMRHIPSFNRWIREDFHLYMPVSHAVRAVVLANGKAWADPAWLKAHPEDRELPSGAGRNTGR